MAEQLVEDATLKGMAFSKKKDAIFASKLLDPVFWLDFKSGSVDCFLGDIKLSITSCFRVIHERGREGEREGERGREGERARGREGEMERGREGEMERERETAHRRDRSLHLPGRRLPPPPTPTPSRRRRARSESGRRRNGVCGRRHVLTPHARS